MSQVQIVAICHSDKSRAGSISSQFSTKLYPSQEALLNGDSIFMVFIVTPEIDHRKPFLQAVESEKSAYIENPLPPALAMHYPWLNQLATQLQLAAACFVSNLAMLKSKDQWDSTVVCVICIYTVTAINRFTSSTSEHTRHI